MARLSIEPAKQLGCRRLPTGQARVVMLYESYVHLDMLSQVWNSPVTDKPELEPCFSAAFHGMELCWLLLSQFICDKRTYVAKRPRIELVANDIRSQCQLLSELVDGELEEEGVPHRLSLTQDFPFDGCPPTVQGHAHSPGLQRLVDAVRAALPSMSSAEKNSLIKVVLNITSAFTAAFHRWTVGIGIEPQLNMLLASLGLPEQVLVRSHNLDYNLLVRPEVVERTLTCEDYVNSEDFFFRTIHLGTECWMYIAINRAQSSVEFSRQGQWDVAAARVLQASRILAYLGDHMLLLCSMNLRDYLYLKVEIEGTSGAGSSQVKAIRQVVLALLQPLKEAVLSKVLLASKPPNPPSQLADLADCAEEVFKEHVMHVYENPDKFAGLYNYAKSLEDIETALLGGFFYKHFCLAANVIGSDARGTMKRAVVGLKMTYETPLFPILDQVRSALGKKVDAELEHLKGRIMDKLMHRYATNGHHTSARQLAAAVSASPGIVEARAAVEAAAHAVVHELQQADGGSSNSSSSCMQAADGVSGMPPVAVQPCCPFLKSQAVHGTNAAV